MSREVSIPVALWVCAALVAHAALGGGAAGVTHVEEAKARDRADIREMVRDVQRGLGVVELDVSDGWKPKTEEASPKSSVLSALGKLGETVAEPLLPPALKEELAKAKKAEPEPEPVAEKPEDPKPEAPKPEPEDQPPPKPSDPMQLLPPPKDPRISIRQAAKDEKDNPNAPRLAENALSVEEETVAKARSNDNVAENPSLGSNARGPSDREGNAENDKNGQAEAREGDAKKAPGNDAKIANSNRPRDAGGGSSTAKSAPGGDGGTATTPAQPAAQPGAEGGRGEPTHDHHHAETSDWNVTEAAPGGDGLGAVGGKSSLFLPGAQAAVTGVLPRTPGLGGGPGGFGKGFDLDWATFAKGVGDAALDEQAARIGAAVRAERKGRFDSEKFQRWLPDIENYDPSVKLGNQTRLNAAQSVFATYLSTIHNAIHPIFADEFLASLNKLGRDHDLNGDIVTHVEIVLTRDEGKIVRMGVTKNSGFTLFDAAALEAIDRAGPFGLKAPDAIVSPDGHVYLHWEFHRDPVDACSTRNSSPFLVKDPKPLKSNIPPRKLKRLKKPAEGGAGATEPLAPKAVKKKAAIDRGPLVPRRKK
jgi:hypothetical protein